MSQIKLLQSKLNFFNGQLRNLQDSGLFQPAEIQRLSEPMLLQIPKLQAELKKLKTEQITVNQAEVLTPETLDKCHS